MVARAKLKTVFSADTRQIKRIRSLVRARRYDTPSAFIREAIDEKLAALDRARLDKQVGDYCAATVADDDRELVDAQAWDEDK